MVVGRGTRLTAPSLVRLLEKVDVSIYETVV